RWVGPSKNVSLLPQPWAGGTPRVAANLDGLRFFGLAAGREPVTSCHISGPAPLLSAGRQLCYQPAPNIVKSFSFDLGGSMQFVDLGPQRERLGDRLKAAIARAVEGGEYIHGPQVGEFEKKLAAYVGVKHVIGCANGTDALQLPLMAADIGPGDAVFVPSFTFAATAEVVALAKAEPVFVDIDAETYNIDTASLEAAIEMVKRE